MMTQVMGCCGKIRSTGRDRHGRRKGCGFLIAAGVELYFEPEFKNPQTDEYWVFLKDPDGNMIELN